MDVKDILSEPLLRGLRSADASFLRDEEIRLDKETMEMLAALGMSDLPARQIECFVTCAWYCIEV